VIQIFHVESGILVPQLLVPVFTAFPFHPSKRLGLVAILCVLTPDERLVGVGIQETLGPFLGVRPAGMEWCSLNVVIFEIEDVVMVEEFDDTVRLEDGTKGHDVEGFREGIVTYGSEGPLGEYRIRERQDRELGHDGW